MAKLFDAEGNEVEAFTAEERDAHVAAEVEKKVGETKAEYEARIKEKEEAFELQKGNLGRLVQLTETQKNKLSEAEKAIYENQMRMEEDRKKAEDAIKARWEAEVEKEVKAKSLGNPDLEKKIRDNLALVNIEPTTIEQVQAKVALARGGVFEQTPDLLATVGGFTGGVYPNTPVVEKKSHADTPEGKKAMEAMGMITDEAVKAAQEAKNK